MCLFTANVLHIIYTYICTYLLQAHTAWGFCMGCDHDCLFRAAAFSWGQWIYETRCKLCLVVKHFKDVTRFVPIYMKVIYTFLLPLMFIYIYTCFSLLNTKFLPSTLPATHQEFQATSTAEATRAGTMLPGVLCRAGWSVQSNQGGQSPQCCYRHHVYDGPKKSHGHLDRFRICVQA